MRAVVLVAIAAFGIALVGQVEAKPGRFIVDDHAVDEARALIDRATLLDELATGAEDSALAAEAAAQAKEREAAHMRETARGNARIVARAAALEAEAILARAFAQRQTDRADENRRDARDMRARAVRLARGEEPAYVLSECDPPFTFDAQGRKHFLLRCL